MLVDAHIHLNFGGFTEDAFVDRVERGLTDQFWVSALQGGYHPTPEDVRRARLSRRRALRDGLPLV